MGTQPHRRPAQGPPAVRLPIRADLGGRLVRRYKRFLADIETESGEVITVHCPNPGAMTGMDRPGSAVRYSTSDNPKRKLAHTLEMVRVGRIWVGIHTLRANQLVARALALDRLPGIRGYRRVDAEVQAGPGSRLDFALADHPRDPRPAWLEVKSATLARGDTARFPDSVTARGRRHLETLADLCARGHRAILLFVVQRGDCLRVECAHEIDPAYAEALGHARAAGVEILAVGARIRSREIVLEKALPFVV